MSRPSPASFSPGPPTMPSPGKLWMWQCRAMIASRTVDIPTASAPILSKNRISAGARSWAHYTSNRFRRQGPFPPSWLQGAHYSTDLCHILLTYRENGGLIPRISADQRIGAGVIDVVLQQHQRSRGKSGMDTACGIG